MALTEKTTGKNLEFPQDPGNDRLRPADQSETAMARQARYGQTYFDKYVIKTTGGNVMNKKPVFFLQTDARWKNKPCCPLHDSLREPAVFSDDHAKRFEELSRKWYEYSNENEDQLFMVYCEQTSQDQQMSYYDWDEARGRFIENTVKHFLFESGQFHIANQGCSQDIYLLLSGPHRGFCHGNSVEYNYSYPFWYQPADHRAAITWPQYRGILHTFEDYLMAYVRKTEQVCRDLSIRG